jgi:hypothetical protein
LEKVMKRHVSSTRAAVGMLSLCSITLTASAQTPPPADCSTAREQARAVSDLREVPEGKPVHLIDWAGTGQRNPPTVNRTLLRYSARIDTSGRPMRGTDTLRGSDKGALVNSIKSDMQRNRYSPAMIGGCTVEGRVVVLMEIPKGGVLQQLAPSRESTSDSVSSHCREVRRTLREREGKPDMADTVLPPAPLQIFLPPRPVPPKVKGSKARFFIAVDADGWANIAQSRVEGVSDKRYAEKVLSTAVHMAFRPAQLTNGCAVERIFALEIML